MRIWDLPPEVLCRAHLLGEHRELHAIWTVITENRKGYSRHPETLRWRGKLKALRVRHEALVREMSARGYAHRSPLDARKATGSSQQAVFVDAPDVQVRLLRRKGCACEV